eukprot:COSAG02_NODE_115_length_35467_cov_292.837056_8_plen_202_part_00
MALSPVVAHCAVNLSRWLDDCARIIGVKRDDKLAVLARRLERRNYSRWVLRIKREVESMSPLYQSSSFGVIGGDVSSEALAVLEVDSVPGRPGSAQAVVGSPCSGASIGCGYTSQTACLATTAKWALEHASALVARAVAVEQRSSDVRDTDVWVATRTSDFRILTRLPGPGREERVGPGHAFILGRPMVYTEVNFALGGYP